MEKIFPEKLFIVFEDGRLRAIKDSSHLIHMKNGEQVGIYGLNGISTLKTKWELSDINPSK